MIEDAKKFETAILIIPQEECDRAMKEIGVLAKRKVGSPERVSVIPILESGRKVGERIGEVLKREPNFMRMSYYDEGNVRLPKPVCKKLPDISEIVNGGRVRAVAFCEAVVESQGTLTEAMRVINEEVKKVDSSLSVPAFFVFALINKIDGDPKIIPNLTAMFEVPKGIWVFGRHCDSGGKGRELQEVRGMISPYAGDKKIPQPYYRRLF